MRRVGAMGSHLTGKGKACRTDHWENQPTPTAPARKTLLRDGCPDAGYGVTGTVT
jgi:hypothetical protein